MELRMELQSFKETDFIQTLFISPSDFVYGIYDHQKYIKIHYFYYQLKSHTVMEFYRSFEIGDDYFCLKLKYNRNLERCY